MQRNEYIAALEQLKLNAVAEHWDEIVTDGIRRKRSTADILERLIQTELTQRHIRSIEYRIKAAKFARHKTLADFVFEQSMADESHIRLLMQNDYIRNKRNIIFIGGPGTGKNHLATATGIHAASEGFRVRYFNVLDLVNHLEKDRDSLEDKMIGQLSRYDLLILDELGYLPFSQKGGALLFNLISHLHEKVSLMLTTNLVFAKWGTLFGDETMTQPLIDRLLHRCELIETGNESFRFKNRC
ncbi:transposase [Neisseria weixii]|uniref:Transposase n=1 Tax=Neisseria weixii TaxID=1853276 RepID=A0A3N4MUX8_9NEIS|nr:IS21-like element helper ATPase IstB [Neisseria weixii]RPD86895.1 transposase [Neisseria weixii]RPD87629.1 transposase [Neisseria weixii]